MILPVAFLIGVAYGAFKAKKRNGNKYDMLHYGATYGIALVLFALVTSIILQRLGFLL